MSAAAGGPPRSLAQAVVAFAGRLRAEGFKITPTELAAALRAMGMAGLARRQALEDALLPIFCSSRQEVRLFREQFESFWALEPLADPAEEPEPVVLPRGAPEARSVTGMEEESPPELEREPLGAGLELVSRRADFERLRPEQMEEVAAQVERLARRLGQRLTRRQRRAKRAGRLDFRASVRGSLQQGGEVVRPRFRQRRRRRLQIFSLVDISGSMTVYGYFFLLFLHSLQKVWPAASSFVFSTHLTPVSQSLSRADFGAAWNSILAQGVNWSGGTDIGASLMRFYREHLRPVSSSSSVVLVVSDGWDRGEPRRMARAMRLISGHCRRLLWLNPLLSSPDYEPICRGMSLALPHLDHLLPFYNLRTLERLCDRLEGLDDLSRWEAGRIWARSQARARAAAGEA
jgi:hypothetical protein